MQNSAAVWGAVEARQDAYIELSDRIWGMPELNFQETRSSAEHVAMLVLEEFGVAWVRMSLSKPGAIRSSMKRHGASKDWWGCCTSERCSRGTTLAFESSPLHTSS